MQSSIAQQITLKTFSSSAELNWITQVLRAQLAQPYSVFTYYYFLKTWPDLTIMAYLGQTPIACIIGSIDVANPRKAYIAMLVVLKEYRRHKVGIKLFNEFVQRVEGRVDKIVLETQCINKAALRFFKTRKMSNYYLSGNDAYRLKLYLRKKQEKEQKQQQTQQVQVTNQ